MSFAIFAYQLNLYIAMRIKLLFSAVLLVSALSVACPQPIRAADYRYSRVRSLANDAASYARRAESYANDAERYNREAERYNREADNYRRQNKLDPARDYQRRAATAADKAADARRRCRDYQARAADAYRRAARVIED